MESHSSIKRIKFSRLCLSQARATKDGQSSNNSVQSSQISKFFNRPSSADNHHSITSTAVQSNTDNKNVMEEDPTTSSNSKSTSLLNSKSETDDEAYSSSIHSNVKQSKTIKNQFDGDRGKTKRLFVASNPIIESNKTIKKFFAAEYNENESLNDFEIPKKVARKSSKTSTTSSTTTARKVKTAKSRNKKLPDIRKILRKQQNGIDLDEDEELQLAVELSKIESNERNDQGNFEQFDYKPKNDGNKEFATIFAAQRTSKVQNKWKSKCTPLTRRDDDAQSLQKRERIDELLTDNILIGSCKSWKSNDSSTSSAEFVFDISSKLLQRICMAEKILFRLNDNDVQSERCLHQYYTNNLVEPSTVTIGALLRNWKEIPGRDIVFDGISMTSNSTPETFGVEHSNEIVETDPAECVEHATRISNPIVHFDEAVNDIVSSMDVVDEITASASTDDTIIVDTNAIEVELNLINAQIRSSQNFIESPPPMNICDSETIPIESHRGPSPDLFDDDDCDFDANCSKSNSLTCTSSHNDVIFVENSPPDDSNEENANNEIIVNKTLISPTHSVDLSGDDKYLMIEISDESNHSTMTEHNDKQEDTEEYNAPITSDIATESNSSLKVLSFTERLALMDQDVTDKFKIDVPIKLFDNAKSNGIQKSQQLSQESIELSDDEINYSMNFGNKSLIGTESSSPTTTTDNELQNYTKEGDINFDYGCNAMNGDENDLEFINQSICEMFEKTFDYHDANDERNQDRDKSIRPKHNTKIWKKTQSERVLGTKITHSLVSFNRNNSKLNINTSIDLSTEDYIIRYGALSPRPDYDGMEMNDLQQELKKFGLKQSLKKRQAIICLEYIFNRTHPFIESDASNVAAKTKKANNENAISSEVHEAKLNFNIGFSLDHLVDAKFQQTQVERFFLPSWPRAKRPWCLQPLHIAWHNLVKANENLFQAILAYKPIELRDLKNYFKTIDMTFDNKDLIAFLDMHCITFRTSKRNNNS